MALKERFIPLDSIFAASYNRQDEWRQCCAVAMGFEWVDRFDADYDERSTKPKANARIQQVINLMEEEEDDNDNDEVEEDEGKTDETVVSAADPWTANALRMQKDLTKMARWIESKKHDYVGLGMVDEEASLIQSTVTTFAATTASELETLRKLIPAHDSGHRQGIVQILLNQLQEQITQPFSILQKQRTRQAVQLWQNPWQCQLKLSKPSPQGPDGLFDQENGKDNSRDKRFMARATLMIPQEDFLEKYRRDPLLAAPPRRPNFLDRLKDRRLHEREQDLASVSKPPQLPVMPPVPKIQRTEISSYHQEPPNFEERLEQEAALLQETIVQSDLDSVQKMEQRMVEITTLIGQFSNLVSEQQEDILDIAQHAQETKQNMTKGQENLVDATERTRRSKHYLAWTIFGLSLILLFFHTLRN